MLFLLAGIVGVLAFLRHLPHVTFSGRVVYPLAVVLCIVLILFYQLRHWTYWIFLGMASAGLFFFIRRHFDEVLFQIYRIGDDLTGVNGTQVFDITMTVVLFVIALVFLFFLLEIIIRSHAVLYVLTTALLLAAPVANIRITFPEILMIAAFQIVFWCLQVSSGSWRRNASGRTGRIAVRSTLVLLALAVPVIAVAWQIVAHNESKLEDMVFSIEGNITGTYLNNSSGESAEDKTDGHVSRGNNYKTGKTKLHITVNAAPTEMLYLSGFSGGDYNGEDFEKADEDEIAGRIADKLGWEQWKDYIPTTIQSMYYAMNLGAEFENYRIGRYITIAPADKNDQTIYLPYYSAGYWDASIHHEDGYQTYYFESKDVDIDWEGRANSEDPGYSGWTMAIRDAYAEEVQSAYTRVPENLLPRLTELVRENPQEGLDNITAFIIYTLQSNASYTMTPGATPLNENTVEYFLFENHRGYCQQFAAAATLMFRMYGIPCRYVSGYRISPSAFRSEDENVWEADATDLEMHAWPEVYTADRGWIPIEVTPAGDTSAAIYPGFSGAGMQEFLAAHGFSDPTDQDGSTADSSGSESQSVLEETVSESSSVSSQSTPEESVQSDSSLAGGTDQDSGTSGMSPSMKQALWKIFRVSAAIFFIALAVYALVRRVMRRIRNLTVRQWFSLMMDRLYLAGFDAKYDGQEEDFPDKLAEFLYSRPEKAEISGHALQKKKISQGHFQTDTGLEDNSGKDTGNPVELIREVQKIVLKAAYSEDQSVTAEDSGFVRKTCRNIMKKAGEKIPAYKKAGYTGRVVLRLIF